MMPAAGMMPAINPSRRTSSLVSEWSAASRTAQPGTASEQSGEGLDMGEADAEPSESRLAYFNSFVPSFVTRRVVEDALLGSLSNDACPDAEHHDGVIYLVDISGFSKLADRFCHGSQREGVDNFSDIVNRLVSEIVEHVNSWGGSIIRFVGDCVICLWHVEPDVLSMPVILQRAVQCALELERLLGTFVVPCQGQSICLAEELVSLPLDCGIGGQELPGEWEESDIHDYLERVKHIKGIPALGQMDKNAILRLGRQIKPQLYSKDELITVSDLFDEERTVFIVHSGILECSAKDKARQASGIQISSLGAMQEGSIFTIRSLRDKHRLVHEGKSIVMFAKVDCVVSELKADILEFITGKNLSELLEAMPQGNPQSENIILRVHQAISCGDVWFAHMGGEALNDALGPRREFLVVGNPILEASEALNDAAAGDLVVGKSCEPFLSRACTHTATARGHLRITSAGQQELPVDVMPSPVLAETLAKLRDRDMDTMVCNVLRQYCHEGSRQLCGQTENLLHDNRQLSVVFFKMQMGLQDSTSKTLETINAAFGCIQMSVQGNQGTILQFVQDDKGLIVVACFGYAPFSQHAADPLRATLATMKIQQGLADLGIGVSIGVTTGAAFAGFAGNDRRRQQCVMGSTVNMAASLMCQARGSVLVDLETYKEASVSVQFKELPPITVKGRDTPERVFRPVRMLGEREIQKKVVEIIKSSNLITNMERAMPLLQKLVSEKRNKCTVKYVMQSCKYLQDKLRSFDHLPQAEAKRHLNSLCLSLCHSNSTTKLFNSSDQELGSTELCYTQSLAKVAVFISHANVFPKGLAQKVFCKSFGVGVPIFDKAFAKLRQQYVIRPMTPFEVMNFCGTTTSYCPDCAPWRCLGRTVCVHTHLVAMKEEDNFVFVKEGQQDVQEHCSQPIQYNRKAWSRISAEWYENDKKLDLTSGPEQILLSLKYEGAMEKVEKGAKFDPEIALKAAYYLSCAAQAAEDAMSYKHAVDLLQRSFNLVEHISDSAGGQTKVAIVKKIQKLCSDNSALGPPSPMSYVSTFRRLSQTSLSNSKSRTGSSTPSVGSPRSSNPGSPSVDAVASPSAHLLNTINRRASTTGSSESSPRISALQRPASRQPAPVRCMSELKERPQPMATSTLFRSGSLRDLSWNAEMERPGPVGTLREELPVPPMPDLPERATSGLVAQHSFALASLSSADQGSPLSPLSSCSPPSPSLLSGLSADTCTAQQQSRDYSSVPMVLYGGMQSSSSADHGMEGLSKSPEAHRKGPKCTQSAQIHREMRGSEGNPRPRRSLWLVEADVQAFAGAWRAIEESQKFDSGSANSCETKGSVSELCSYGRGRDIPEASARARRLSSTKILCDDLDFLVSPNSTGAGTPSPGRLDNPQLASVCDLKSPLWKWRTAD